MTTIACNKETMACDLQVTYGGSTKLKTETKIVVIEGEAAKALLQCEKALVGYAGITDGWGKFLVWLNDVTQEKPKLKNIEFLALTNKKEIYHGTNFYNFFKIVEPCYAIGSGMQFALGAMQNKASPKDAVRAAMKYDVNTGIGVKEYKL